MSLEDYNDAWDDDEDIRQLERRPFYLEASRPVDRAPTAGQQMVDAWRAEHGDEEFPQ